MKRTRKKSAVGDAAYSMIAARVFNTPLMIETGKLDVIVGIVSARMGMSEPAPANGDAVSPFIDSENLDRVQRMPLNIANGVAVIDVCGTLVHMTNGLQPFSGMTPYQGIAHDLETATNDPRVASLLFRVNSPGGEADGVFDLCDAIATCAKPTAAVVQDCACSAAYMLAAACDTVFVSQNGRVGSIGVIARHIDRSQAQAAAGILITHLYQGERKADWAEPLTEDSHKEIMAQVEATYQLFVDKVVSYRGIPKDAVLGQQSRVYYGVAALAEGLADAVGTEAEALAYLADDANHVGRHGTQTLNGDSEMRGRLLASTSIAPAVAAVTGTTAAATAAAAAPAAVAVPAAATAAADPADDAEDGEDSSADEEDEEDAAPKAPSKEVAAAVRAFESKNPAAAQFMSERAAHAERTRVAGLEALCQPGEESILAAFKAEGVSVGDAAVAVVKHRKKRLGATHALRVAERASPIAAAPTATGNTDRPKNVVALSTHAQAAVDRETKAKEAWESDPNLRAEFGDSANGFAAYAAWLKIGEMKKGGRR